MKDSGKMLASSKAELKKKKKQSKKSKSGGFELLGLSPNVYNGIKKKGYRVPTPIQRKIMPLILAGYDIVAMTSTGSGKTAAFLIHMLQKLRHHVPQAGVRALIFSRHVTWRFRLSNLPENSVALHIFVLAYWLVVIVWKASLELTQNADCIIATPGRLMHHVEEIYDMSLRTVEYVVFDEADCLFSMGLQNSYTILAQLGENRQTLLFRVPLLSLLRRVFATLN